MNELSLPKKLYSSKKFEAAARKMKRSGGSKQKAAAKVSEFIGDWRLDPKNAWKTLQRTSKTGGVDKRISNCIKFHLSGHSRLITRRENDCLILLFIGDHDEVEAFLDSYKTKDIYIIDDELEEVQKSGQSLKKSERIITKPDNHYGKIIKRLDDTHLNALMNRLSNYSIIQKVQDLDVGTSTDKLKLCVLQIQDKNLRVLFYDVLALLNSGAIEEAINRIKIEIPLDDKKSIKALSDISDEDLIKIKSGTSFREVVIGSDDYRKHVEILSKEDELDWLFFMHPDQEKLINKEYNGPAKLSGVSGSGKTCILIKRAISLAEKSPKSKICIVTLNRSLASLINSLVNKLHLNKELLNQINVISFFELCQQLLDEFEPENKKLYSDITWGLNEHIDEVFREFYRCQQGYLKAEVLKPVHLAMLSQNVEAEKYIKEEFDYIRSSFGTSDRAEYLEMKRTGRVFPIQKNRRELILKGLDSWETKMTDIGVIDYLGLTNALHKHLHKLKPLYEHILVDEVQDFGTTELEIIRKLVLEGQNDLFLCGDLAQHILPKSQNFNASGIQITGRTETLLRNYRNTREILNAAHEILIENLDEAMMEGGEMELQHPEFSPMSKTLPMILKAKTLEEEIAYAIQFMKEQSDIFESQNYQRAHRGCIAIVGYTIFEISNFAKENNLPYLDGGRLSSSENLVLSDLEQTKGYEFDTVIIVNCNDTTLPPRGVPKEEAFRIGCQLYVAMTRAKTDLIVSYHANSSVWLQKKTQSFEHENWPEVSDPETIKKIGVPGHLPEVVDSEDAKQDAKALGEMTGKEFIYSRFCLGLEPEILQKLEKLVTGKAELSGRHRIKWDNIKQLETDLHNKEKQGRTAPIFGPSADQILLQAFDNLTKGSWTLTKPLEPAKTKKYKLDHKGLNPQKTTSRRVNLGADKEKIFLNKTEGQINSLNIPKTYRTLLKVMGIDTVLKLSQTPSLTIMKNPRIGQKGVNLIREALKRRDINW